MESDYQKSFFTKISDYQLQVETTVRGIKYITISRSMVDKDSNGPSEQIHIHPDILNDLIDSLQDCSELIGLRPTQTEKRFPLERKNEIQFRYLRGVSVKDLCIQFDTIPEKIEKILLEANIEIIDQKYSKPPRSYRRYRKKS